MTAPRPTQQLRLVPSARFRVIDEEGVIVLLESAEVIAVNGVGARILQLVGEQATESTIVNALVGDYGISTEQARHDLEAFVGELCEAGVLHEEST